MSPGRKATGLAAPLGLSGARKGEDSRVTTSLGMSLKYLEDFHEKIYSGSSGRHRDGGFGNR